MIFPDKIFVTGTGTGVGKTIVSAILACGLDATYWKPVQSGLTGQTDTEMVKELTKFSNSSFFEETYRLSKPLSPHASALLDSVEIDLQKFKLPVGGENPRLIVEGAGGIMVPLNRQHYMLDLMIKLNLPVILVADSGLGTINHTLLSIDVLRFNNLSLLGVVMNGSQNDSNREALEYYGKVPVIAEIEPVENIKEANLKEIFSGCFIS